MGKSLFVKAAEFFSFRNGRKYKTGYRECIMTIKDADGRRGSKNIWIALPKLSPEGYWVGREQ
jgi:hypothetical protein